MACTSDVVAIPRIRAQNGPSTSLSWPQRPPVATKHTIISYHIYLMHIQGLITRKRGLHGASCHPAHSNPACKLYSPTLTRLYAIIYDDYIAGAVIRANKIQITQGQPDPGPPEPPPAPEGLKTQPQGTRLTRGGTEGSYKGVG